MSVHGQGPWLVVYRDGQGSSRESFASVASTQTFVNRKGGNVSAVYDVNQRQVTSAFVGSAPTRFESTGGSGAYCPHCPGGKHVYKHGRR